MCAYLALSFCTRFDTCSEIDTGESQVSFCWCQTYSWDFFWSILDFRWLKLCCSAGLEHSVLLSLPRKELWIYFQIWKACLVDKHLQNVDVLLHPICGEYECFAGVGDLVDWAVISLHSTLRSRIPFLCGALCAGIFRGVIRIGILAKGLLLTGNRDVELVMLCAGKSICCGWCSCVSLSAFKTDPKLGRWYLHTGSDLFCAAWWVTTFLGQITLLNTLLRVRARTWKYVERTTCMLEFALLVFWHQVTGLVK